MDGTIFLCLSGVLLVWAVCRFSLFAAPIKKKRPKLAIFGYRVIYSDTRSRGAPRAKLLKSQKDGLTGKPDMIYQSRFSKRLIPVELKSGTIKDARLPHRGDLLQLGAYCLLIEENYGVRPVKGHLLYKDALFVVRNTERFRKTVRAELKAMRAMLVSGEGVANPSFVTCRYCLCRGTVCEQNIMGFAHTYPLS